MSLEFVGLGWAFPLRPDDGDLPLAGYEDSVRDSIWLILKTSPGERVMRPSFGCGLDDLVFAPASAQTSAAIATKVTEALTLWEPRIDLVDVQVGSDPAAPATVFIEIDYRLRATNTSFNLVFPFYLLERAPG